MAWILHWLLSWVSTYFNFLLMKHFQENGEVKSFTGNSDTNTVKKNALPAEVYTKAIRFFPKTYSGGIALRVELYGYPAGMLNVFTYTQWLIETRFVSNMPWNTKCVNSSYGEVKRFFFYRFVAAELNRPCQRPSARAAWLPFSLNLRHTTCHVPAHLRCHDI